MCVGNVRSFVYEGPAARAQLPVPTFSETGRTTLCYRPKRCAYGDLRARARAIALQASSRRVLREPTETPATEAYAAVGWVCD